MVNDVNCCGKIADLVYDASALSRYRNAGLSDEEAYDLATKGWLCTDCMTWTEINEDGKIFVVHIPTGQEVDI